MANISQKWLNKELEILSVFSNEYDKKLRESGIVQIKKMPQRTVSRKLNLLAKTGILDFVREGKNKVYFLKKENPVINPILMLIESYKTLSFLGKHQKIALILEKIEDPCLVFGSYAKGNKNEGSDIDLAVFTENKKEIEKKLSFAPFEIHAQFTSLKKFEEDLKNKNQLAMEIAKNHILIKGFDNLIKLFSDYYW